MYSFRPAKNVVLAGVRSVTIYDPDSIKLSHLSSQVCRRLCMLLYPLPPLHTAALPYLESIFVCVCVLLVFFQN